MSTGSSTADEVDLEAWLRAALEALGLAPDVVDTNASVPAVLDLVRDVAHGLARPAGPLAAFAVGVALGARGLEPADGCDRVRTVLDGYRS